jgi:hypothetical protein
MDAEYSFIASFESNNRRKQMLKEKIKVLMLFFLTTLLIALVLVPLAASGMNENCGERDETAHSNCNSVRYKELPADIKRLMGEMKCEVKTGSNYDYGYAVDLNSDGNPEYAFCCHEAPHGPCEMVIFGKYLGKWKVLYNDMAGFDDQETPCLGFVVLKEKHAGYNDLCVDYPGHRVIRFKNGKYHDVIK